MTYTAIYKFQAFKLLIQKREKEEGRKIGGEKKEGTILNNLAMLLRGDDCG